MHFPQHQKGEKIQPEKKKALAFQTSGLSFKMEAQPKKQCRPDETSPRNTPFRHPQPQACSDSLFLYTFQTDPRFETQIERERGKKKKRRKKKEGILIGTHILI